MTELADKEEGGKWKKTSQITNERQFKGFMTMQHKRRRLWHD